MKDSNCFSSRIDSTQVIHGTWVGLGSEEEGYFHVTGLETSTEFGIIHTDYAKCWDARNVQYGPYPQRGLQSC